MTTVIDKIAELAERAGFSVDIDGDGYHVELLDYPSVPIFLRVDDPERLYTSESDFRCVLSVKADNEPLRDFIQEKITTRLATIDIYPQIESE